MCACLRVCVFVAPFPFCLSVQGAAYVWDTDYLPKTSLDHHPGVGLPPFVFNKSWKFLFYGLLPQRMMPGASWKKKRCVAGKLFFVSWQVLKYLDSTITPPDGLARIIPFWIFFFSEFWRHLSSVFLLPVISFISFLLCLICVFFFFLKPFKMSSFFKILCPKILLWVTLMWICFLSMNVGHGWQFEKANWVRKNLRQQDKWKDYWKNSLQSGWWLWELNKWKETDSKATTRSKWIREEQAEWFMGGHGIFH